MALPVISAVLRGPAARLLFRHSAGHRARIRGRCRGRGRPMGLGESPGGAAATPTSTNTTTSTPIARKHFKPLERGRWEWAGWQFRPRAWRTGGPSRPFASLRTRQCGAAFDTPGWRRRRGRHRRCRAAWAVLGVLGGRAVQAGWAVLAVPAGRAVRGAWEASAVRVARAASAVLVVLVARVVVLAVPAGRPSALPARSARAARSVT